MKIEVHYMGISENEHIFMLQRDTELVETYRSSKETMTALEHNLNQRLPVGESARLSVVFIANLLYLPVGSSLTFRIK